MSDYEDQEIEQTARNGEATLPTYGTSTEEKPTDGKDKPPTYTDKGTLAGKLKVARQTSTGKVDYCRKSYKTFCEHVTAGVCQVLCGFSSFCLFGLFIPTAEIIIGSVHINDCPINPNIPIYLIVAGIVGFIFGVMSCIDCVPKGFKRMKNGKLNDGEDNNVLDCMQCILMMFYIVWLITGACWVFGIANTWSPIPENINHVSLYPTYCDPILFRFSFWLILLQLVISGGLLLFGWLFCLCCCFMSCDRDDDEETHILSPEQY